MSWKPDPLIINLLPSKIGSNEIFANERVISHLVVSDSLWPHGQFCSPPGSSVHGDSPGKNTGVGSLSLLQGIFPTQGLNPRLPHCRQILYQLGHQGSPRILEWVAYPFSRETSQPRNWTKVSCIAGWFFTYKGSPMNIATFINHFKCTMIYILIKFNKGELILDVRKKAK